MDPNDSLDNFIEYDPGSNSDKENELTSHRVRPPKTTDEQFNKMSTFVHEHSEQELDKTTYDMLWENLAAKLNDIGPPEHTTSEWRRIWSVRKYNNKRKRLLESDNPIVDSDEPSSSASITIDTHSHEFVKKLDVIISNQSELSGKVDIVMKNQSEVIANQQKMIRELQKSNKFLQEISNKSK